MSKNSDPKKFSTLIDELIPPYQNNENDNEDDNEDDVFIDESEQQEPVFIKKQPPIIMNKRTNSKVNRKRCYFNFNLRSLLLDYQDEIRIFLMTCVFVILTNQSLLTLVNTYVPFFFETTNSISYNLYGRVFIGIMFALIYAFMWLK
jgi:hypothetical protein